MQILKISEVLSEAFSKVKFIAQEHLQKHPKGDHAVRDHKVSKEISVEKKEVSKEESKKEQKERKKEEKKEEKAREKEFTDRPKHPSSAYIRFSTDNMSKVKTEYPQLEHNEVISVISKIWNQLSAEEKLPYEAEYQTEMVTFKEELNKFYARHPELKKPKKKNKK